jgi:hypothetical protein
MVRTRRRFTMGLVGSLVLAAGNVFLLDRTTHSFLLGPARLFAGPLAYPVFRAIGSQGPLRR